MATTAPFRIACRSPSVQLRRDATRQLGRRAFSCGIPWSYPRTRPVRSATSRLRQLASDGQDAIDLKPSQDPLVDSVQAPMHNASQTSTNQQATTTLELLKQPPSPSDPPVEQSSRAAHAVDAAKSADSQASITDSNSSLPWYLQPEHAISKPAAPEHLLERQRIPELPESSPELLDPLLKYASADLGIDYLTLMDLRSLDPPAALGTNLMMMIGTARGEKHLHVSADRLCRWLRSNYKVHPQADGLLGRGEFKIKMRRRTKRLKILAHVGSVDSRQHDDGLGTGWVCVTFTDTTSTSSPSNRQQANTGFVGFGESSASTTVVMHLMTEEKREELDLEELWKRRLEKRRLSAAKDHIRWTDYDEPFANQQGSLIG